MKIRIKIGDCPSYLTVGKVYEDKQVKFNTLHGSASAYRIVTDNILSVNIDLVCDYFNLNGGSWEVVDD